MKSKDKFLVSVIIPIYNVQDYLEQCLLSVINQTYKNIEIICVDDGSTDNSSSVVEKFVNIDKRIKLFHKENGGLSSARNCGIDHSTGDYIVFVDSDDFVDKDYVKILLSKLLQYNCDTCICLYYMYDKVIENPITTPKTCKIFDKYTIWDNIFFNLFPEFNECCLTTAWNKIYKRDFLIKNKFISKVHEDDYMSIKLFENSNKILVITDKLYYYRINRKNSIMSNLKNEGKRDLYITEVKKFNYNFFKEHKYPKKLIIAAGQNLINSYCNNINFSKNYISFLSILKISLQNLVISPKKYNIKLFLKIIYKGLAFFLKKAAEKKRKSKISVIIPVYNSELFLEKCLSSVVNQKYKNLEIIIVNDGSTDNSSLIINNFAKIDKRIKVYNQKNTGCNVTLNNAIKYATGKYLCFLDSDDFLANDVYEFLNKKMKNRIDLCLFNYSCVDKKSNFMHKNYIEHIDSLKTDLITSLNKNPSLLINFHSAQWSACYKTSMIRKNDIKFDNTLFGYDVLFHLMCIKYAKKILVTDTSLINYRIGDLNSSSGFLTRSKFYSIHFDCFNHCVEAYKNENNNIKAINICHQFEICCYYLHKSLPKYKKRNSTLLKEFLSNLDPAIIDIIKSNKDSNKDYLKIMNL